MGIGPTWQARESVDAREEYGIKHVRGCELWLIEDESGEVVEDGRGDTSKKKRKGDKRRFIVEMDAAQYQKDLIAGNLDIYERFNVLMRRKAKENNFKAVLSTIRQVMNTPIVMPDWLRDVFLGYGDPGASSYKSFPREEQENELDFNDTFIDPAHLEAAFPDHEVTWAEPPMTVDGKTAEAKPPFKCVFHEDNKITASYYIPENPGPYPHCQPPLNTVRFTPVQTDAIRSAMNRGLTMVVGPPGTGKTDVAVQIVTNLYHNYPNQRSVMVTHSNSALNDLFEKIMERDVDERHLLRLGRGEELLETEKDFSKWGRVDYMLGRRLHLLSEVDRLARALAVPQDVSQTCETAAHFNTFHVLRRWEEYLEKVEEARLSLPKASKKATKKDDEGTAKALQAVASQFPFMGFFLDAPQPLFPSTDFEADFKIAEGCYRYIQAMFDELDDCRAFELLRTAHDRSNYLLTKQARIIAMTCTHAAITRSNLMRLAFEYDTLVMEESAQIMEIETFIPMLLQASTLTGGCRLKRLVLIGDHHQLPPVVKNMAFQKYCHLDQSLFTRFVRLGVPYIELNMQGRARASIATLYNWRYRALQDLPHVDSDKFQGAVPGFKYDYQLINVDDYQGRGEHEPTPHFTQNLGEAEYIVATFMYMRLMGIPASKISIITTYRGQKHLIRDVIAARCSASPYFGEPAKITTVDKFQGQQNDYVLVSLVRTKIVGHLRDVRRLVVAMSRSRLGVYVFGRESLFSNCIELAPTFDTLRKRETKLVLVQADLMPTKRKVSDVVPLTQLVTVQNVTHMGAIVTSLWRYRMQKDMAQQAQIAAEEDKVEKEAESQMKAWEEVEETMAEAQAQAQADDGDYDEGDDDQGEYVEGDDDEVEDGGDGDEQMAEEEELEEGADEDEAGKDGGDVDMSEGKTAPRKIKRSGTMQITASEAKEVLEKEPRLSDTHLRSGKDDAKADEDEPMDTVEVAEPPAKKGKKSKKPEPEERVPEPIDDDEEEDTGMTEGALMKLKAVDLKKLCKEKALNANGRKADLVSRLLEYSKAERPDSD